MDKILKYFEWLSKEGSSKGDENQECSRFETDQIIFLRNTCLERGSIKGRRWVKLLN